MVQGPKKEIYGLRSLLRLKSAVRRSKVAPVLKNAVQHTKAAPEVKICGQTNPRSLMRSKIVVQLSEVALEV